MHNKAREDFINHIAANPLEGEVMVGTGGARKARWSNDQNSGKSGGVRVIYYHHDEFMPIFLFTVYEKGQRANISQAERNALKIIIKELIKIYEEKHHE